MEKYVAINECDDGSTGTIGCAIAEFLSSKGVESHFFVHSRRSQKSYVHQIKTSKTEYAISRLLCKIDGSDGFWNYYSTKKLISELKAISPDIVHLHNIHGHYINMSLLMKYLRQSKCKILWTFHDCWPFTGKCSHFSYIECNKWTNYHCPDCGAKRQYPRAYLFNGASYLMERKKKILLPLLNRINIITPSLWLQGLVKKSILKESVCECIHNGISFKIAISQKEIEDERNRLKIAKDKIVVFSAADPFNERKGFNQYNEIAKNSLNENFVFIVAGLTEKQKNIIPQNVISIGKIRERNRMALFFSLSDVFLNTTLEDNYPTVNIESIICGTPVVTFDSGGSGEMVNKNNGLVVKKKDIDSTIAAIKEAAKLKSSIKTINVEKYSEYHMCEQYYSFIKSLFR